MDNERIELANAIAEDLINGRVESIDQIEGVIIAAGNEFMTHDLLRGALIAIVQLNTRTRV